MPAERHVPGMYTTDIPKNNAKGFSFTPQGNIFYASILHKGGYQIWEKKKAGIQEDGNIY